MLELCHPVMVVELPQGVPEKSSVLKKNVNLLFIVFTYSVQSVFTISSIQSFEECLTTDKLFSETVKDATVSHPVGDPSTDIHLLNGFIFHTS